MEHCHTVVFTIGMHELPKQCVGNVITVETFTLCIALTLYWQMTLYIAIYQSGRLEENYMLKLFAESSHKFTSLQVYQNKEGAGILYIVYIRL